LILVDTSVWIDHFRRGSDRLAQELERGQVLYHPLVLGELACGNLHDRASTLGLLGALPTAAETTHDEALVFVEKHRLMGRGLGYLDVHLLASAALEGAQLWTLDARLADAARQLGLVA